MMWKFLIMPTKPSFEFAELKSNLDFKTYRKLCRGSSNSALTLHLSFTTSEKDVVETVNRRWFQARN